MTSQQFGELYFRHEKNIRKVLNSKKILDEDLINDTYIALYEDSQHNEIGDFVNAYVEFYVRRYNWQKKQESQIVHYDHAQFAELEIFDESVGEEAQNKRLDNDRITYREQCIERLHEVIDYYFAHPQPGERNRRRACRILRLYRQGLSEPEISRELKISQPTVHQYLERIIERLKAIAILLQYRGA